MEDTLKSFEQIQNRIDQRTPEPKEAQKVIITFKVGSPDGTERDATPEEDAEFRSWGD